MWQRALLLALAISVGCGQNRTGGGMDGGQTDGGLLGARQYCDRYLACLAKAIPSAFPGALQVYGDNSTCWTTTPMAAELCGQSCISGLASSQVYASSTPECGCRTDAECTNTAKSHCNVVTGVCEQCHMDSHCPSSKPICSFELGEWQC